MARTVKLSVYEPIKDEPAGIYGTDRQAKSRGNTGSIGTQVKARDDVLQNRLAFLSSLGS
jgi:hypothetical protein